MKISFQVVIEQEGGGDPVVDEVACLERGALNAETLGLTLAEARELLAGVQQAIVSEQVAEYIDQQRHCSACGKKQATKHDRHIVYRTLFGKLKLFSPRLYSCPVNLSRHAASVRSRHCCPTGQHLGCCISRPGGPPCCLMG